MSHTTTINSLGIRDESAIKKATDQLAKEGVNIRLERNAKPRMYFRRQEETCDYVLRLDDAKAKNAGNGPMQSYDVGLKKQPDGTFAPVFDEWREAVRGQIGATCPLPTSPEERGAWHIGRWAQAYAKHAAINAATADGYMVTRDWIDTDGNVQLEVMVSA